MIFIDDKIVYIVKFFHTLPSSVASTVGVINVVPCESCERHWQIKKSNWSGIVSGATRDFFGYAKRDWSKAGRSPYDRVDFQGAVKCSCWHPRESGGCSGLWILKGANMKKRPVSARGLSTVRVRTVFGNLNHRLSIPEGRLNLLTWSLLWPSAYFQSFRFSWLISSILYFLCVAYSLVNFDVD